MATILNKSTALGDVILIRADVPIIGLIALTDFIDNTTGEDATNRFVKEFRYSTDAGLNYVDWIPLSAGSLGSIGVQVDNQFIIEYRYSHIGNTATDLTFQDLTLSGTFKPQECGPIYKQSLFADYFSCYATPILQWALNVTEKLYKKGVVPSYLTRGQSGSIDADRDYVDFWRTVATFFAYCVMYARRFERFYEDERLLREYLRQSGFIVAETAEFTALTQLASNMLSEVAERGTNAMLTKGTGDALDGELLRIISFQDQDELIFAPLANTELGWCIGQSSPLYAGIPATASFAREAPILPIALSATNPTYAIDFTVDPRIGYAIAIDLAELVPERRDISLYCQGYDRDGNIISLLDSGTSLPTAHFLRQGAFLQPGAHRVELEIDPYRKRVVLPFVMDNLDALPVLPNRQPLNIGQGGVLRFSSERICRIRLTIIYDPMVPAPAGSPQTLQLTFLANRPRSTPFSRGFVQTNNLLILWLLQRNGELSQRQFENYLRRYLLPYNTAFKGIYFDQQSA